MDLHEIVRKFAEGGPYDTAHKEDALDCQYCCRDVFVWAGVADPWNEFAIAANHDTDCLWRIAVEATREGE
jgi:hypothetical protein